MPAFDFPLDRTIYSFNNDEPFTIGNACEGVQIFGGIGSGKTSGSGEALARAFLMAGFGGLVLCAKKDVLEDWKRYARETGRAEQVLVFDDSGDFVFPFLQYEIEREGEGAGYTDNLVRLFTTIYEALDRSVKSEGSDPYWERAMQQLLRNTIDLCMLARGTVSVPLIHDVILSAPMSIAQLDTDEFKNKSLCWKLILEGYAKNHDRWAKHDFDCTAAFWLEEYPNLADKTRSSIISTLSTMMDIFLRRPFRRLFSEMPDDRRKIAYPELSHRGVIIILNLPVKEFGDAGRAAQVVYKYLWQQAVERRAATNQTIPVFLWVDEAQNFVTEYDMQFQATARSARACTVYLTQNLPNYYAVMGGTQSKYRVDSLMGNLQTKIWHANSDPMTNDHAAETIGRSWQTRVSSGESYGADSYNVSSSKNESFDYDVPPQSFTKLHKGGALNNRTVEAIVFQNGRLWKNEQTHLFAEFTQYV
ncbi:type IV secretory system conjugative DNA transfer family protein [Mucilaginibacter flavidus]|uniref:type IV secretory system conjugative DNA transfer family protein n=1 Tax=Mucilaginibacter flavidus TaxID=2949309 RepID=UPI0020922075|nr:TraM recognition domain-containing protein [Mucilaginibacter flavidus]MCO5946721.1 type IV secretory system conjugative DNA transfer family protein [Mucilaginibacter flavidus]